MADNENNQFGWSAASKLAGYQLVALLGAAVIAYAQPPLSFDVVLEPRPSAINGIHSALTSIYDVAADDSRFFWIRRARDAHTELHVVVNWLEELRRKVPN